MEVVWECWVPVFERGGRYLCIFKVHHVSASSFGDSLELGGKLTSCLTSEGAVMVADGDSSADYKRGWSALSKPLEGKPARASSLAPC